MKGVSAIGSLTHSTSTAKSENSKTAIITTTLYELIEAISEEVPPWKDNLVIEIVLHLLDTKQIKFIGDWKIL